MLADRLKIGDIIGIVSPSTPIMGDREEALNKGRELLSVPRHRCDYRTERVVTGNAFQPGCSAFGNHIDQV